MVVSWVKAKTFTTMTVRELQDILPDVLPYLALSEGYRFMIDGDDYGSNEVQGRESQDMKK